MTGIGTCRTCVHWEKSDSHVVAPLDPDTYEPIKAEFEVRECTHPKLLFCERPYESNGFAVCDGSTYMASLFTAEDFGCARHSSSQADRERDEEDMRLRVERELEKSRDRARTLLQKATKERWVHQFRNEDGEILGELAADAGDPVSWKPPPGTKSPVEYWLNKGDGFSLQLQTKSA